MSMLFEPARFRGLSLRNRLVRSATFEGMADADGFPTQALFDLYRRLARGGVGLIVTGYAYVSADGRNPFPGMLGIDRDEHIPRYRELVEHVHGHGAALALQIAHCGRQTTPEALGELGFDGIEVSCGIAEDGMSTTRGEVPIEAILESWEMVRRKSVLFRGAMRVFGRRIVRPPPLTEAFNRAAAKAIKERVDVPVFLVGGLTGVEVMEDVLESGDADLVSLCRALIADARFPGKLQSGRKTDSICVHCNLCLAYMAAAPLRCYHGKRPERA